jgi:hypothetical protein
MNELYFADANFVEIGLSFYVLGAYLGMVIDAKYYDGTD